MHNEYPEQIVNLARNQNSLVVVAHLSFCKQRDTHLPQLMNTSGFYQNVDEGNKSLNAMSPDPLLSEAFGKRSGCARRIKSSVWLTKTKTNKYILYALVTRTKTN